MVLRGTAKFGLATMFVKKSHVTFGEYYLIRRKLSANNAYHNKLVDQSSRHEKTNENNSKPLVSDQSMMPKEDVVNEQLSK